MSGRNLQLLLQSQYYRLCHGDYLSLMAMRLPLLGLTQPQAADGRASLHLFESRPCGKAQNLALELSSRSITVKNNTRQKINTPMNQPKLSDRASRLSPVGQTQVLACIIVILRANQKHLLPRWHTLPWWHPLWLWDCSATQLNINLGDLESLPHLWQLSCY